MADRRLHLHFSGSEPLGQQETHLAQGALFVPVPEPGPEPQTSVPIRITAYVGGAITGEAMVVHVFPGTGMALAISDPATGEALAELFAAAKAHARTGGELEVTWEEPAEDDQESHREANANLLTAIRALSVADKRALALKGGRGERLVLAKDTNKTLQTFLLKNPRITVDEIRAMAANRQATPETLRLISDNRTWMQSLGVVSALVRNPKTPAPLAVRLLERLPLSDVRQIAKSNSASMPVLQAAKRKVLSSGGR